MSHENPLLEVRNLAVQFDGEDGPIRAVDDISFHVDRGEILAVVGESGSGKSITALSIMRLLPPAGRITRGAINFRGRDLLTVSEREIRSIRGRDISMIFQEPMTSLNPVFTVGHQISEAIVVHQNISRAAGRALTLNLLEAVEIPDPGRRIDYFPHQMSGGQRQRIMIAMALALRPSLIIADEPTTALDVIIQAQILELLKRLQQEIGASVLFITHDLGIVAEMADRAVVMQKGRIVEHGPVIDIFKRPQHPYTQKLLSAVPRIDAAKTAQVVKSEAAPLLDVRGLSKWFTSKSRFGTESGAVIKAVNNISLSIRRGEVLGLVGESGSGKTTAGRSILRLVEPTAGQIMFDGTDVTALSKRDLRLFRRKMQIIFQDPYASLNPRWTVAQMLLEPLKIYGLFATRKERERRIANLLELVELDPAAASRYPHEFSGGQRQRIGIARSLAVEPSFIVADECVSALDVSVRREILNLIKDLRSRLGLTMLFISHDLAVIEDISDRVAVMYAGELVEVSTAHELYRNPRDTYTKALLAAVPIPDPTIRRERVHWDASTYVPESTQRRIGGGSGLITHAQGGLMIDLKHCLFISLGALGIFCCSSVLNAQGPTSVAPDKPLVIANNVEVPTFDPQKVVGVDAIIAVGNLYDRLVSLDESSAIQPALATSWETSPDGRVWTFKLRHDAKFHDGSPVTSEAVKFSVERAIGPDRPSSMARTYLLPIQKVDAPDPFMVVVTTKEPFAPMLNHFAHPANGAILNPAVVKAHNDDLTTAVDAGSGMYRLGSWSRNNELVLLRNEEWWGPKPPYAKVVYKPITQAATRVITLEKGEVDAVTSIPAFEAARLGKNPKIRVTSTNSIRTMYFAFNMRKPALQDVKVREAFNYAVNVDGIIKSMLEGHGARARSVITNNLKFYYPGYDFKYDPQKAQSLLKDAGIGPSTKLTLFAPKGRWSLDSEVAQAVAGNLRNVGLDIDLRVVGDWGQYQQALQGGDFDLAMYAWAPGSFDPDATFSSIVASTGAANFGKYHSADADGLIRLGAENVDPNVRAAHYKALQELLGRDVPYLLLYDIVSFSAARVSVCGISVRGDEANVIKNAHPC